MAKVDVKRIYEPFDKSDGFRILVDGLWPRGVKKEDAKVDVWLKEIAPSSALIKWFNHDPEKWNEFTQKYKDELKQSEAMDTLKNFIKKNTKTTLLYAARDIQYNNAVALQGFVNTWFNK